MLQKFGEMLDGLEIRHLKDVPMFGLGAALCTRIMEICTLNSIYSFSTNLVPFVLTNVATLEETFTINCGCFQNLFGVHRNVCCQILWSKVAEWVSKSVSFLFLMWPTSTVVMATLHFVSKGFVWLSRVTEIMTWSMCRFKRYLYILQGVPAFFTFLTRNIPWNHIIHVD